MNVKRFPYTITISEHNKQCHFDIEKDMHLKLNGIFSFIVKVNDMLITDYTVMEYGSRKG